MRHTHDLASRWQNRSDGEPMRLGRRRQAHAGRPRSHNRSDPDDGKKTPNNRPHGSDSF
jgi:hypothetical protein